MEIVFSKRTSVEEVEEGKSFQPKFDENGLIHHKNIKGTSLRQAIEELVSNLEASQSAKSD